MPENGDGRTDDAPAADPVEERLREIEHKMVIISGKGGVGKSTVATNMAMALARGGSRVGLMDIDIHGPTVPKLLAIDSERIGGTEAGMEPIVVQNGLRVMSMGLLLPDPDVPVIWRGPKKMGAIRQFISDVDWGPLDYLVVDLPPGTGDEPLSIAQLIKGAGAIIVTTPQDVAMLQSRKAVTFARALELPVVGIVENMSGFTCPSCGAKLDIFHTGGGRKAAREMNVPFLGAIPMDTRVVETGEEGRPLVSVHPDSDVARAFLDVVDNVKKHFGE